MTQRGGRGAPGNSPLFAGTSRPPACRPAPAIWPDAPGDGRMAATAAPGHRIAARLVLSARAADKHLQIPPQARRDQPRQASPPDRRETSPASLRPDTGRRVRPQLL